MKTIACVLAIGLTFSTTGQANDPGLISMVMAAAQSNHAVEGLAYNQPATAVPIAARPCPRVGLVYEEHTRHRRGPRIDNFITCPGQAPETIQDVSPSLPDDRQFQQLTLMAVRGALRYGEQRADWSGYHVETHRLSYADPQGCAQVETIVVTAGLLVSYHVGRMCP
jgi:hypothetical protein